MKVPRYSKEELRKKRSSVSSAGRAVMPPIPSKWYSRKHGTRHVIDRTGGGDIVYIQGRLPLNPWKAMYDKLCTLEEWGEYQKTAKAV